MSERYPLLYVFLIALVAGAGFALGRELIVSVLGRMLRGAGGYLLGRYRRRQLLHQHLDTKLEAEYDRQP